MPSPINVRLPQRLIDYLDKQAGDVSTRSAVIRRLLAEAADQPHQSPDADAPPEHRASNP
jgi:Arc/MetJ-type ribon-helix-helix transcriptional regulator